MKMCATFLAAATAIASLAAAGAGYRLYNVVPMCLGREAEQAARWQCCL